MLARASHRQHLRNTAGRRWRARLAGPLCGGLAVLVVALTALRLWPAASRLSPLPGAGAASRFAAASFGSMPPEPDRSEAAPSPATVPMPPPLASRTLIIHARAYPLQPVITGGDPATGALPVPPVRAIVQVDSPAVHTFSHPPSVPVAAPSN